MGNGNDRNSAAPPCYAACFDSHPNETGRVVLRESPHGDEVVIIFGGRETKLADAIRDQWGVFVSVQGVCVAQEDDTRSFLDALIGALSELRRRNEITTAATVEAA